ncbi:MAG: hypothetical protein ACOCVR_01885 [Myxococcota bacterium]
MFIGSLKPEQQHALSRIVRFIAEVDDDDDFREDVLCATLLEESSLQEVPLPAESLEDALSLVEVFDEASAAKALILESFGVALSDNYAHPKELEVINALAAKLGVEEEWVEHARDYVQRVLDLQIEAHRLLTE